MTEKKLLLNVKNVGKSFDMNRVLENVNFTLNEGEILGLIGENGAGKSTLMNILFGMKFIKDTGGYEGEVDFAGEKIDFSSPVDALNKGIGMVHQEFSLLPGFTVAENIALNMEDTKPTVISKILGKKGKKLEVLDMEKIRGRAKKAMETLGVDFDSEALISELPVGHKQFIEIAREINRSSVKLIIMDEPTAVLTESEADILLKAMRDLANSGISIIFISHRLREIKQLADKIVVLRDGVAVKECATDEISIKEMASLMVGREITEKKNVVNEFDENRETILSIKNLYVDMPGEIVKDVSIDVKKGEILGIAGLAGQGKLGISNGIMGIYKAGGEVTYKGKPLPLGDTMAVLKEGITFVSEDRRGLGLLLDEGISWNIAFNAMQVNDRFLKKIGLLKFRDEKAMRDVTLKYIDELQIKTTGPNQKAGNLSGGNQQKVCLAKAFAMEPELLFVSEPTRGIDIGAKQLVLEALKKYNREMHTTVVMISSELEELRSIADRIAVVYDGRIFGVLNPQDDVTKFGLMMAGEEVENG